MADNLMYGKNIAIAGLGPEWQALPVPSGGVELTIPTPRGRGILLGGAVAAAFGLASMGITWTPPDLPHVTGSTGVLLAAGAVLGLLLLRHVVSAEVWHLERNCLERRVKIGPWVSTQRFLNAQLEVVQQSDGEGGTYNKLYAVVDGKQNYLLWRNRPALEALAAYVSKETGFTRLR